MCPHPLVGKAATISAEINQEYLQKPYFKEFKSVMIECNAKGIQVAHSGTLVGFIFSPLQTEVQQNIRKCRAMLDELGLKNNYMFEV